MRRPSRVPASRSFVPTGVLFVGLLATAVLLGGCGSVDRTRSDGAGSASILEDVQPNVPLEEQVARIAGVYLNEYRELRIRGSVGPPLVIVDGMRMGNRGDLSFVSPYDVEQIEVVKGPQTAYYGMGGRDGVVLVTTKRGESTDD